MIDVHAPENGIHNFREFSLHLLTITIGLLIALGLEAGVEAYHHRHQREQAETLIRQEIQNNLSSLQQEAPVVRTELHEMNQVLEAVQAFAQSQAPAGKLRESDFTFHESPIQDAAWRTANSTGVLNYMDYSEVERFAAAYKEQELLQAMEERALDDYLEIMPILSKHAKEGSISPDVAKDALVPVRHAIAHLNGMLDVGAGTEGSYEEALQK
jgi:hypothetical protein